MTFRLDERRPFVSSSRLHSLVDLRLPSILASNICFVLSLRLRFWFWFLSVDNPVFFTKQAIRLSSRASGLLLLSHIQISNRYSNSTIAAYSILVPLICCASLSVRALSIFKP